PEAAAGGAAAGGNAKLGEQPATEKRADHANHKVTEQPEAATLHQDSRQPAGYDAHDAEPKQIHVVLQILERGDFTRAEPLARPGGKTRESVSSIRVTGKNEPARPLQDGVSEGAG